MSEKRQIIKGLLQHNVCLAPFTSWRIGGVAEKLYWPKDLVDLQQFLQQCAPDESLTWLGLGSNVLVRDGGISGTVIITQGVLSELSFSADGVYAQSGISCAQVARFAAKHNQVGGEFLAGIPGTVGGALFMNAGAFGGETWEVVATAEVMDRQGNISWRCPDEFAVSYRHVSGLREGEWFVGAKFQLKSGDGQASLRKIKELLARRAQTQPTGEPTCGSVFRNPEGDYAARLIESLGLKGYAVGDAQVSAKHANFIVNQGTATAAQVESLIAELQERVRKAYHVELEPEVKILGKE